MAPLLVTFTRVIAWHPVTTGLPSCAPCRRSGQPDDVASDAGAVWSLTQRTLRDLDGNGRDAPKSAAPGA